MKHYIFISLCLLFSAPLISQTENEDYFLPDSSRLKIKNPLSTSISAGGMMLISKNGSSYASYIAPKISYQLNKKFRLNLGMINYTITGNSMMALNNTELLYNGAARTASGNLIMLGGEYLLSNKLLISGSVMKDVNALSKSSQTLQAATLGFEYKTGKHSTIKFETMVSQGSGNYLNSPGSSYSPLFTNSSGFGGNSWIR